MKMITVVLQKSSNSYELPYMGLFTRISGPKVIRLQRKCAYFVCILKFYEYYKEPHALRGLFGPPKRLKYMNHFYLMCSYWFIRTITKV